MQLDLPVEIVQEDAIQLFPFRGQQHVLPDPGLLLGLGDAVAQPVLQAGQMATILGFLFLQSFTFGLAACAFIPLQAWLIPKLQRQVNKLNKKRVIQLRALARRQGVVLAKVIVGGVLTSRKGVNFPDTVLTLRSCVPLLTKWVA